MNWRTTLILAVVVLAVFAYLRFFEMKQPSTEEARRQAQNVVNFDRNKIDGIVIQNGDEKIEIRRHDNKWRLATPFKDQADGALVENLLSDLETWQKEGTIPAKDLDADKSKLNEYGLNRPKLKLKLIGSDRPPEILFGKDAALEGRMYVRFENSKETFLAKQSVKKDIDKKAEEFRDKKLTDLTTAQVRRIAVKTPAGEMELEKKGDHWDIVKPLLARPVTHYPRRLKRSSTLSQPIYATITWFELTQTFSIGLRSMFQAKVRLFLHAGTEIGQSRAEIMRPQIRAPSAA